MTLELQREGEAIIGRDERQRVVAEIFWETIDPQTVVANHTYVDRGLRGQGIGHELIEKMVNEVRKENKWIIPRCPFTNLIFSENREYDSIDARKKL